MKLILHYFEKIPVSVIVIFGITVVILVAFILLYKSDYMKIDRCLDSGGKFNHEINECEYQ